MMDAAAATLLARLQESGLRLAVAESCTGGLLGATLTSLPGASAAFAGGVIAYANDAKQALLGVPEQVLLQHGAVSEECALAMARGALLRLRADVAVSVTGIAGPGGGTPAKPVGTVWLAAVGPGPARAERHVFAGGRDEVRQQAVAHAVALALRALP
ncbi:MAG TPA: CinA family protein [Candidatus Thermoplasmatota archaeon]|nr:CinA family protein [Candidatus Thermoplasmatota archaeon]